MKLLGTVMNLKSGRSLSKARSLNGIMRLDAWRILMELDTLKGILFVLKASWSMRLNEGRKMTTKRLFVRQFAVDMYTKGVPPKRWESVAC